MLGPSSFLDTMFRMATDGFGFYLSRVETDAPTVTAGGSGYFSTPSSRLDPRLFVGDHLRDDVRHWVLTTLYSYWDRKYRDCREWSTVWAAGSGISYQWAADRSNGDLDILIGVDFPSFFSHNPTYAGLSADEMADLFNQDFHAELWPRTANWRGFEVTFYVNPNSTDIRNIHPYAAYDITHDVWTIRPPVLPQDPRSLYPAEYWKAVSAEQAQARGLVEKYGTLKAQADAMAPGSPGWVNAQHAQGLVVSQAKALFDSIHLGRKNAFGPGGSGYGDFYNFRWQAHKEAGTVQALNDLASIDSNAHKAQDTGLYGAPIKTAAEALAEAALWNTPHRRF